MIRYLRENIEDHVYDLVEHAVWISVKNSMFWDLENIVTDINEPIFEELND